MKHPMKVLCILLLSFLGTKDSVGQALKKGTVVLRGSGILTHNFNSSASIFASGNPFSANLSPSVGFFLSNRLLLGMSVSANYINRSSINGNFSQVTLNPELFGRYYFAPEDVSPFKFYVTSSLRYGPILFGQGTSFLKGSRITAGGGMDIFLSSNVVLTNQATFSYLANNSDFHNYTYSLQTSLMLFITRNNLEKEEWTGPGKGAFMIGGSTGGLSRITLINKTTEFNEWTTTSFALSPNVGYFFTDRLMLGTGLSLGFSFSESVVPNFIGTTPSGASIIEPRESQHRSINYSVIPFIRYYINSVQSQWRWFTQLDANFSRNTSQQDKGSSYSYNSKLSLAIGANFLFNEHAAFEMSLGFDAYNSQGSFSSITTSDYRRNGSLLNFSVGYQYFLYR